MDRVAYKLPCKLVWIFVMFALVTCYSFGAGAQPTQSKSAASDFRILPNTSPSNNEILYFFWYGSPHAYDLSPQLNNWRGANPNTPFQMVPVVFREDFTPHSQIFYTFEELGRPDMHLKVMYAIHTQNKRLLKDEEIGEWVSGQGFNKQDFLSRMNSQSVMSKVAGANAKTKSYLIDGVPTFVVYGKYVTSPSISGSKEKTFLVIDYLTSNQSSLDGKPKIGNTPSYTTSPNTEIKPGIDDAKVKCASLGFKSGTQEFGKCVLQLSK